ncbi:MAG TPA: FAD:protein FMN transferase [Acidimicrobiales bacterium]|jgi:thiamine biosynthesis lipoprotein|nr:FAD:protein FMN transferase [Acidimicrobiales bacterium]
MVRTEYALGTVVTLEVHPGRCSRGQVARGLQRAAVALHRADEVFSVWKPDSPMSRVRREELSLAQAPPEIAEVLGRCAEARRLSRGWYDPWAGPGGVDPTVLARGWALGRALRALRATGADGGLVTAGQTAAAFGAAPGRIGGAWEIEAGTPPVVVHLDGGVAGSVATATPGGAGPGGELRSASVVGPDPALASALAAAVLAAGPAGLALMAELPAHRVVVTDRRGDCRTAGQAPLAATTGRPPTGRSATARSAA